MQVCVQELQYQQEQSSQRPVNKFVSVVSQFITVASLNFSDVEDSLQEAKDLVSYCQILSCRFLILLH